jgi:hypothetical protein
MLLLPEIGNKAHSLPGKKIPTKDGEYKTVMSLLERLIKIA